MGVTEVTHPVALNLGLESMCFSRVVACTPRESQILATQKIFTG